METPDTANDPIQIPLLLLLLLSLLFYACIHLVFSGVAMQLFDIFNVDDAAVRTVFPAR